MTIRQLGKGEGLKNIQALLLFHSVLIFFIIDLEHIVIHI